jgi:hypothetical protein
MMERGHLVRVFRLEEFARTRRPRSVPELQASTLGLATAVSNPFKKSVGNCSRAVCDRRFSSVPCHPAVLAERRYSLLAGR